MADQKISELTDGGAVQSGDKIPAVRASANVQVSFGDLISGAEIDLGTAHYTVASGAAADTEIWKLVVANGWGRLWLLKTDSNATDIDTSGALDSANIPGSELTLGDWFIAKTRADQDPYPSGASGVFILNSFTSGSPASNIDLKNLQAFGFANTD